MIRDGGKERGQEKLSSYLTVEKVKQVSVKLYKGSLDWVSLFFFCFFFPGQTDPDSLRQHHRIVVVNNVPRLVFSSSSIRPCE